MSDKYYLDLDDRMFEHEKRAQGWAFCPDDGGDVYFYDHTCAWKCSKCGAVFTTAQIIKRSPRKVVMP